MKFSPSTGSPYLDDPRVRLAWIAPLAILLWFGMLSVFAILMGRSEAPSPPSEVKAQIIEMAPAGGGAVAAPPAPAAKPQPVPPPPVVHHHPVHHRAMPRVSPHPIAPPHEETPEASAPANPASSSATNSSSSATSSGRSGPAGGAGPGVPGIGSGNAGARAIYAPAPVIPDDLRENEINTVAVAHFIVGRDGAVAVTLSKPTDNPQLNAILLDTLKQWRFFPAMSGGGPIATQFDLRIPVTVQ